MALAAAADVPVAGLSPSAPDGAQPVAATSTANRIVWNPAAPVHIILTMVDSTNSEEIRENAAAETVAASPEVYESFDDVEQGRFLKRARRIAARLPFVRHIVAMYYAMRDEGTPIAAKALIVGAIAYFMLPTDLIPDFLAGIGFTDDAAVVIATLKTITAYLKPRHYQQADDALGHKNR